MKPSSSASKVITLTSVLLVNQYIELSIKLTKAGYMVDVKPNRLWLTKSHGLFSVSNGTYGFENIENSKDYGATWNLELTSFNFSINK